MDEGRPQPSSTTLLPWATILCVFCMEMWVGAENGGTKENRVKLRKISKITEENTWKGLASMKSRNTRKNSVTRQLLWLLRSFLFWLKRPTRRLFQVGDEKIVQCRIYTCSGFKFNNNNNNNNKSKSVPLTNTKCIKHAHNPHV